AALAAPFLSNTWPSGSANNGSAMTQIISEEKRRQIIVALNDNPNAKQVAQKIGGVSDTTVGKIAKAAGIALAAAKSGKRLSAEQRAQIIAVLKDNPNATQVALEVGWVNYRTVVRLAEGAGIGLTAGTAARVAIRAFHRRSMRKSSSRSTTTL